MQNFYFALWFVLFLFLMPVSVIAQDMQLLAISETFKYEPTVLPETRTALVATIEPEFPFKAGRDIFQFKVGSDRFRYEYEGEYIEFQPLEHLQALPIVNGNEATFSNFWTETDLKFAVHPYGVNVDIVLQNDRSPTSFSFRVTKSADWQDNLILPVYAYATDPSSGITGPIFVTEETVADVLTYTIEPPKDPAFYPITIDPTFDLSNSVDDTSGWTQIGGPGSANQWSADNIMIGELTFISDYRADLYARWALNIPRASKITASNLSMKCSATYGGISFTARVYGLSGGGLWQNSNGFNTTNYSNGTALEAITKSSSYVTWSMSTWVVDTWYDSSNIASLLQEQVDDLTNYDPSDSEDKYIGFKVDENDAALVEWNQAYSYDWSAANAPELDVTYTPWGEIRNSYGMKYNSDCNCMRYYDY
jgi:hypothetical protein